MTEALRLIREEEPPRPSSRLSETRDALPSISALRKLEPARLTREVRGDLDWIVMKALDKDRNRRYASPGEFAEEIGRYLNGEAILARPPRLFIDLKVRSSRREASSLALRLLERASVGSVTATVASSPLTAPRTTLAKPKLRLFWRLCRKSDPGRGRKVWQAGPEVSRAALEAALPMVDRANQPRASRPGCA